jgi:hypothetical protein
MPSWRTSRASADDALANMLNVSSHNEEKYQLRGMPEIIANLKAIIPRFSPEERTEMS